MNVSITKLQALKRRIEEDLKTQDTSGQFLKRVHFIWPPIDGRVADLVDPTPTTVDALFECAALEITKLREGASGIYWRVEPEWLTERNFISKVVFGRLFMRGTFYWSAE